jgi:D-alanine-D-alanine ligase-like ATP-grasp enzyme
VRKISVAVIYGGKSSEHEVSILSASSVLQQLNREKYTMIPIGISKSGQRSGISMS